MEVNTYQSVGTVPTQLNLIQTGLAPIMVLDRFGTRSKSETGLRLCNLCKFDSARPALWKVELSRNRGDDF